MRWAVAARVALLATAVVCGAIAVGAPQHDPPVATGGRAAAHTPMGTVPMGPVQGFRSVREYVDVAEPVRLRIPAIGVDTPLQRLGRAPDQTIEVPTDFGTAGWFAEGPRPGQPGPAVVLGHVDSRAGPAVFYRLSRLARGATVLVDRADATTVGFRVEQTLRVPKAEFPTDLVYAPTLEPSLRLVTCGGSFDAGKGSYRDNVIVDAEPTA